MSTVIEIGRLDAKVFGLTHTNRNEHEDERNYYAPVGFENELVGCRIVCCNGLTLTDIMGKRVEAALGGGHYAVGSTRYPYTKITVFRVTDAPAEKTLQHLLSTAPRRSLGRKHRERNRGT